ncbi:SCO family protein [Aestuariicoccus sp. MJ-SS9]|uniref:SCO family protein n=1 Tax=Aestuariicoccus sp. MJ-SS9 TaxID=3079855 RepID=UPI0029082900|nr:SCO family protein [Aestuariicoccus sp. MJ-SS9]MDU8910851.1 SCO family protein [Aestuariicoccus sp. MJ-SS9]
MNKLAAVSATVAIAALVGGIWYVTAPRGGGDVFADCRTTRVAGGDAAIGGPFELVNGQGETVTDADVITGPTLIYFGYTFCPDICPLDNVRNADAVDLLEDRGYMVTPVFISIDPARDTPDVMADYAANMHPRMIGLTGNDAQVKAASQAYRTYYRAQPAEDEFYLVDHSTFTYFVLPEHGFVEYFRRELPAEELADRMACFLDKV